MTETKMQLEDWLDDLCVRFIINLPREELESVERICFQVEEAQWFYEDFIRPLDPALPSLTLKTFAMRIFQHCPLMSQWSTYHHQAAFSEFLAYKTRVPVRGAILLNEDMDEVVLVKGWKKGANWSFPRGKINKGEKDLDCAIREVYEETGFDVREANLVKDEDSVKYIEITMREQHMRLYVFPGVPQDTYFEPRTRKEISKIEWYKLTELPTLKKNKQHDEGLAVANANKFYMVAPFLHPLKKWIAQQKKISSRVQVSAKHPSQIEGYSSMDENAPYYSNGNIHLPGTTELPIPSDLPEVNLGQDASSHIKQLLQIGGPTASNYMQTPGADQPPPVDQHKSNALLALLRKGSQDNVPQFQNQPVPQPNAPHHALPPLEQPPQRPPNFFPGFPPQQQIMPSHPPSHPGPPFAEPQMNPHQQPQFPPMGRPELPGAPAVQYPQGPAPNYPPQPAPGQGVAAPHASKLPPPKLTSHSLSLLNFFKDDSSKTPVGSHVTPASVAPGLAPPQLPHQPRKTSHHQDSLLDLFKGPKPVASPHPVELSGQPVPQVQSPYEKHIIQRAHQHPAHDLQRPLNTPKFEAVGKTGPKKMASGPSRKSQGTRREQPQPQQLSSPITILPRPQSAKRDAPMSGSYKQAAPGPSPPQPPQPAQIGAPAPVKPFQPQILRRSEKTDYDQLMAAPQKADNLDRKPSLPGLQTDTAELSPQTSFDRRPSQNASQKEALLSLFGKPAASPTPPSTTQLDSRAVNHHLSHASGLVSPLSSLHLNPSSGDSISRRGTPSEGDAGPSGANNVSSPSNKAFLLGYLQGVAKGNK
ncbi:hypothetical protein N7509_002736 [Penicillium cosmopolitanum]|uniref:Nudix hydrolase domain-containing protein n=1 Tax=Penicillium cosmopolitanum TaxID=1131564 RepID=A0A9X0BDL8_9EURO|nr:uncharacterized protein N7509_002736 [Penicillium cosmopolitanum]KAJ5408853.1 hypothetical protein N7509_002736 [Penicillium cosmopolitanum]